MVMSKTAETIKIFRKASGLSQQDLADKMEVSKESIIRIEEGGFVPSSDVFLKMCDIMNVKMKIHYVEE